MMCVCRVSGPNSANHSRSDSMMSNGDLDLDLGGGVSDDFDDDDLFGDM